MSERIERNINEENVTPLSYTAPEVHTGTDLSKETNRFIGGGGVVDENDATEMWGWVDWRPIAGGTIDYEEVEQVYDGGVYAIWIDSYAHGDNPGPGETWQYRATVEWKDPGGGWNWEYGSWVSVTLDTGDDPAVTTKDATNITASSVTLNAEITDMGDESSVYGDFEWRKGTSGGFTELSGSSYSSPQSYSEPLSGLDSSSLYEFRAILDYTGGWVEGTIKSFTTLATAPTATTVSAIDITESSARMRGSISSLGDYSEVWYAWVVRKVGAPTWGVTSRYGPTDDTSTTFTFNVTGLDSDTNYEFAFCLFSSTSVDDTIAVGTTLEFTTDEVVDPTVLTYVAYNIEDTSVTLPGYIDSLGSHDEIKIRYYLARDGSTWDQYSDFFVKDSTGLVIVNWAELLTNSGYSFKFMAYDMDENFLTQGITRYFTTKTEILVPAATTDNVTNIESTSATLNGTVDSLGSFSSVCYRYRISNLDTGTSYLSTIICPISSTGSLPGIDVFGLGSNTNYETELYLLEN